MSCANPSANALDPNVPPNTPVPSALFHLHVLNKTFPGVNFSTMCIKQTKTKKNPLRSSCITSYQGTGSSGTTASGVSPTCQF